MLQQVLEIFRYYEDKIHSGNYEQFTIDFMQDNDVDLNDYIEEEKNERRTKVIIGSLHYKIRCILKIIREGKDKELFAELEKKLDYINLNTVIMEIYNTTIQWFSRYDKENYPKEDCEVLLWQRNPTGYATVKGQFIVDEYNSDDELIEEAMFFPIENTHCMNSSNSWNDDFEYWCYLPKLNK